MFDLRFVDLLACLVAFSAAVDGGDSAISTDRYPSIQAALDANPGRVVQVVPGEHPITETIRISTPGGGLDGSGTIVQTTADRPIIRVDHADRATLRGLTLTRSEGARESESEAVIATDSRDISLSDLRVLDNQTRAAAIELRNCDGGQVRDCLIQNYQRISIDDRTPSPDHAFAFRCVIGTGILVRESRGVLIQGNHVREDRLVATPEIKQLHGLGQFTKREEVRGRLDNRDDWARGETDNWMQGTAIHIASPESTARCRVIGNLVERAGQGFDIHADHVLLSQNIVDDALIGMKAMHGSRHVAVLGNQFIGCTLWAIAMMPGAASHAAQPATGNDPARPANIDGGSIIANNIISDFGLGQTRWIWGDRLGCPLRFDRGQLPANPPLADVLIQGNVVYDTGRDDQPQPAPPRYRYAVQVESGPTSPVGLHFSNNLFHPGTEGVSNVQLIP